MARGMNYWFAMLLQEAGQAGGEDKPGMDLWKWLNFALLAGILGWLIAKNLGPMLVSRTRQIQEGLAAGEKAKADAAARSAAVQAKLANLGQAISDMKTSAREERDREADRIRRDTQNEFARIRQNAQREIESAGKLARLELKRFAAQAAIDLAEQKLRARMSADTQAALINNFIREMADGAAKAQTR